MILLSYHLQSKVQYPIRIIIVQCLSCWISAFVYRWIGIKCQYSIMPPTMMHFVWNRMNPLLLSSIYTNTPWMDELWTMEDQWWRSNGMYRLFLCSSYRSYRILIIFYTCLKGCFDETFHFELLTNSYLSNPFLIESINKIWIWYWSDKYLARKA
jgi:hypothetical protein